MITIGPEHFINRELSWLEFNQRVLDEALDRRTPLLERLKFFCIVSSNLDEFFEVRVAGLKQQIESGVVERSVDGLTATETFRAVHRRVRRMVEQQYACWRNELVPELEKNSIRFLPPKDLGDRDSMWIENFYRSQVRPVLTPLSIDPAHPFPQLLNRSLNLIVRLELTQNNERLRHLAVVQVPGVLPRLVPLPRHDTRHDFVLLGQLVGHYLSDLFPGARILGHWLFRVTRNSELYIDEEETGSLLKAVETELHNRRKGAAVRLEIENDCPLEMRETLLKTLNLTEDDLYVIDGPLSPGKFMAICDGDHSPELRDPPHVAPVASALRGIPDYFAAIRSRDILLHHPYETFGSVVEFLERAAEDPSVLAIKQTLYRSGGDPRIIGALMNAVNNGKQVTAVVELRARFDEANNILWARQLEEAGVHVVYGVVGYKIHGKMILVVRRDADAIRRYVHIATGNYNPNTAKLYTDIGILTCQPDIGEDATNLFNILTGICQYPGMRKLMIAPFELHDRIVALIYREAEHARQGLPARIIARMNALVDRECIEALYRASQAGVKIDLIVRGICCLRPGMPGMSENITVRSIVDRFLEHSRVFCFENACRPEVIIGSADWMPRNFYKRIEVCLPVEDGNIRERLMHEILAVTLADNTRARLLQPDGSHLIPARRPGQPARRSQADFVALARKSASEPPEKPNRKNGGGHPKLKLRERPAAPGLKKARRR